MNGWKHIDADSYLTAIEALAEWEGLISSEDELSERFDSEVAPSVIAQYGEDDAPAMNEAFCDWTDMLERDGELHRVQCDNYCYVGKWSN